MEKSDIFVWVCGFRPIFHGPRLFPEGSGRACGKNILDALYLWCRGEFNPPRIWLGFHRQGIERRFMLVLSRKKDESIIVRMPGHEDVKLTVVRIDNMNKVRIGVEADKEVVILRAELEDEVPSTK